MSVESKLIAHLVNERALRLWGADVAGKQYDEGITPEDIPERFVSLARQSLERDLRDLHQKDCSDA